MVASFGEVVRRAVKACMVAAVSLALCGCGGQRLVSVRGTVTQDGAPLATGVVIFHPDTSKGNRSAEEPRGQIKPDGSYELFSGTRRGAAPGWYKVSVIAAVPKSAPNGVHPRPKSLIDRKYATPVTSGLQVEVTPTGNPRGVDFRLVTPPRRR